MLTPKPETRWGDLLPGNRWHCRSSKKEQAIKIGCKDCALNEGCPCKSCIYIDLCGDACAIIDPNKKRECDIYGNL